MNKILLFQYDCSKDNAFFVQVLNLYKTKRGRYHVTLYFLLMHEEDFHDLQGMVFLTDDIDSYMHIGFRFAFVYPFYKKIGRNSLTLESIQDYLNHTKFKSRRLAKMVLKDNFPANDIGFFIGKIRQYVNISYMETLLKNEVYYPILVKEEGI